MSILKKMPLLIRLVIDAGKVKTQAVILQVCVLTGLF